MCLTASAGIRGGSGRDAITKRELRVAGGYSARADQGEVLITRRTADGTATYKVPVTTQLYPGDVVYVRERWF